MWQDLKNVYHLFVAILANVRFSFPSKKLTVIGVTGTDGKTTTVSLIYHILKEAGYNVSMVSSVGAIINGQHYDVGFHVTTPSSFALQSFFKKTVNNINPLIGVLSEKQVLNSNDSTVPSYLVLEVTSHAIDQYRIYGIDFKVAVLTNITHEHLDYHKTYENYVKIKTKLLKKAQIAVVNKDDESYKIIKPIITSYHKLTDGQKKSKLVTYGLKEDSDVNPKKFPFKTTLIGKFNKYNSLAAIGACRLIGVSDDRIVKAINSFKPPLGREEIVYEDGFTVMIDFAHTPNALEQLLSSVKPTTEGRLIHVFGSAGERDNQKRPDMGNISSRYANVIVLTAEDPRSESVDKIMDEIASGVIKNSKLLKVADRQKAIETAIRMAKKGDLVLITGKGHEKSMNFGRGEVPWDEYQAVKKALDLRSRS